MENRLKVTIEDRETGETNVYECGAIVGGVSVEGGGATGIAKGKPGETVFAMLMAENTIKDLTEENPLLKIAFKIAREENAKGIQHNV